MSDFQLFKEISIGGLEQEQLIKKLVGAGVQFNKYANILFEHPLFSPGRVVEKAKLVKVKLSGLQLNNPCSFQEITKRASGIGLKLCPLYLGAFLRLEYLDQPAGHHLTIASALPESDENYPNGFYVRNIENTLWLRGYRASGDCEWPDGNEFIFLK